MQDVKNQETIFKMFVIEIIVVKAHLNQIYLKQI